MTASADFGRFLDILEEELEERRTGVYDRVVFAVRQVGTTMRIDMKNEFDPAKASELVDIAAERDVFLKVYFTDWQTD